MRLKYHQSTLHELVNHEWWSKIKKMHLPVTGTSKSCFERWYKEAETQDCENYQVVVASYENRPIAISMFSIWKSPGDDDSEKKAEFMLFVIPSCRKMGVGKKLYRKVRSITSVSDMLVYPHDNRSRSFFNKVLPKSQHRKYY